MKKYGAQDSEYRDRYQHFQLEWKDPEILQNRVILVDTIGTEDTKERYIQQTLTEMERGAAILFLFNMAQAGTDAELKLIEKYLSNTGKKLFIALNQSDTMNSDADRSLVLANFKERFQPIFDAYQIRFDERIFVVSALCGEGLDELRQHLVDFVANDRFKELLLKHTRQLKEGLTAIHKPLQSHLQNLQNKKNGDVQKLKQTQKQIEAIEQNLMHREDEIDELKEDLINQARDSLKDKINDLSCRSTEQIRNAYDNELKEVITDMLNGLQLIFDRVGATLQRDIGKNLNQRIHGWSSLESNDFEPSISSLSMYDAGKLLGGTSTAGGVVSVGLGATQAFTAYTAVATTAANIGIFASAWAALAGGGGTVAAPVLTTLMAGVPFVASGLVLVVAGRYLYKTMSDKKIQHNRDGARKVIKKTLKNAEKKVREQIRVYVYDQVDTYFSRLKTEMEREKRQLGSIINEKDLNVLQQQIDNKQESLRRVLGYLEQLKTVTPAIR